jgi:hypothetical protein
MVKFANCEGRGLAPPGLSHDQRGGGDLVAIESELGVVQVGVSGGGRLR